ncbi:hypothetical protein OB919_21500, partial [Halobacteria archaeon AArc-curdl1]|nr:hypothetical protein [Halobacteria archaeon AArc-curdl1]
CGAHEQVSVVKLLCEVLILRTNIHELLNGDRGTKELDKSRAMEQLLYLCYGNASQTSRYKDHGEKIVSHLIANGETRKQDLMRAAGLNPKVESDDRKFKRVARYLRGSWDSEGKNPLHTENHGFVVSSRMEGTTSYYQLSPGEFKRAMNVVVSNIRSFIDC